MLLKPSLLNHFAINLQTPERGPYVPRLREIMGSGESLAASAVPLAHDPAAFRRLASGLQAEGESRRLQPDLAPEHMLMHAFPLRANHEDILGRAYPRLGRDAENAAGRNWQLVAARPELRSYASLGVNQVCAGRPDGSAVQIRHRGVSDLIHLWVSYGRDANELSHQGALDGEGNSVFTGMGVSLQHELLDHVLNPTLAGLHLYHENVSPYLLFALWSLWQIIAPDSLLYKELFQDGMVFRTSVHPDAKPLRVLPDELENFLLSGQLGNDNQFQIESARTVTLDDTYSHRPRPVFVLRQSSLIPGPELLAYYQDASERYKQQGVMLSLAEYFARQQEHKDWAQQQFRLPAQKKPTFPPLKRRLTIHYYQTPGDAFPPGLIDLAGRVRSLLDHHQGAPSVSDRESEVSKLH